MRKIRDQMGEGRERGEKKEGRMVVGIRQKGVLGTFAVCLLKSHCVIPEGPEDSLDIEEEGRPMERIQNEK